LADATDKIIKSLEKRVKDLEVEVNNNRIRNKRLTSELDTTIAGILKSISKDQQETYAEFRKELKDKVDGERKQREAKQKEYDKKLGLTHNELKKLLR
jgi:ribosomal protein S20